MTFTRENLQRSTNCCYHVNSKRSVQRLLGARLHSLDDRQSEAMETDDIDPWMSSFRTLTVFTITRELFFTSTLKIKN